MSIANSIVNKTFSNRLLAALCLLMALTVESMFGQQDAQYTQYMYNTVTVNPAYAGSRGHMSIALLHRSQWIGLEGAPQTQTLNVHSPIGYRGVGLGLSMVQDKIGPTSETNADIDFSYTLHTSKTGRLSFGLKASAHLLDVRFSELDEYSTDDLLKTDIDNKFSPNFGAGVYYHTDKYYVGLSVPRILETTHFDSSKLSTAKERMNYYLISGYVFELNKLLKFKPAVLAKVVQGAPFQLDMSTSFLYNDKFVLGAGYRWGAAISGLVGFQMSNGLFIGMAYDKEVTDLGKATFNDGSFEVIIRFDFISVKDNLKSPRFF
ncbi:MAG: type IX secretion system membrane protein PorP/SprF [Cellulophaga sp.]